MFAETTTLPVSIVAFLLMGLAMYGVSLFYVRIPKVGESLKQVNWGPFESVAAMVAILLVSQLFAQLVFWLFFGQPASSGVTTGRQFVLSAAAQISAALLVFYFLRKRQTPARLIGWIKPRLQDLRFVVMGYALYFVPFALVMLVAQALIPGLDINQRQALGFQAGTGGPELAFVFVALVILPPLAEELMFRGVLYSGLRKKFTMVRAGLITSTLFALGHLQGGDGGALIWLAALDTFILSMAMVYVREKSCSLWPGIWMHMIKNCLAFLALFVFRS